MVIDPDLTLEELTLRVGGPGAPLLAEALPRALRHETLRHLCERHDVPLDALVSELRRAVELGPIELGVSALIGHILRDHHDFERHEAPRLAELAGDVARLHGRTRPELIRLSEYTETLADELEAHLAREERVLFPFLLALEAAAKAGGVRPQAPFASLRHPLQIMSAEHAVEDSLLESIRSLTGGYACPADADEPWRELIDGLRALDVDLTRHVLLEDGVLFPLALALEEELQRDA
ncbi:MAG: hemerythrin domain-containing protein [Sandaracinaceae bacterium]|nr:hemerythrin domain-containing protein [Sandaracinaceae bacterium]